MDAGWKASKRVPLRRSEGRCESESLTSPWYSVFCGVCLRLSAAEAARHKFNGGGVVQSRTTGGLDCPNQSRQRKGGSLSSRLETFGQRVAPKCQ